MNKTKEQHAVQISTLKTTYEDEIENIKKTQNALYKRIQQLEAELKQKDQVASQLEEKLRLSKQSKTLRMPPSDMFTAIFTDQGKFQINQHIHELMLFFKKIIFIYYSQAK
ncbi:MAG: hypothetical protein HWD59_11175 [Coxiellaceae bacterium]|nr:MAG: hypothetical protein HWD59_11175 [Coxiellaceae bacterium]